MNSTTGNEGKIWGAVNLKSNKCVGSGTGGVGWVMGKWCWACGFDKREWWVVCIFGLRVIGIVV